MMLMAIIVCVSILIIGVDAISASDKLTMLSATNISEVPTPSPIDLLEETVDRVIASDLGNSTKPRAKVDVSQWKTVRMRVTGYCACRKCCGKFSDGITANGHKIRRGDVFVAADKKYRFNTQLSIDGYNSGRPVKVMDRGRVIKGNRLDVFFNSHSQAKKWGVKYIDVKIKK